MSMQFSAQPENSQNIFPFIQILNNPAFYLSKKNVDAIMKLFLLEQAKISVNIRQKINYRPNDEKINEKMEIIFNERAKTVNSIIDSFMKNMQDCKKTKIENYQQSFEILKSRKKDIFIIKRDNMEMKCRCQHFEKFSNQQEYQQILNQYRVKINFLVKFFEMSKNYLKQTNQQQQQKQSSQTKHPFNCQSTQLKKQSQEPNNVTKQQQLTCQTQLLKTQQLIKSQVMLQQQQKQQKTQCLHFQQTQNNLINNQTQQKQIPQIMNLQQQTIKNNQQSDYLRANDNQIKPLQNQNIQQQKQIHLDQSKQQKQEQKNQIGLTPIFRLVSNLQVISSKIQNDLIQKYDPIERSIIIKLNDHYNMMIKNNQQQPTQNNSLLKDIPFYILFGKIFFYLNVFEFYIVRGTCKYWMEGVKKMCFSMFKRQMFSQVMYTEVNKQICMIKTIEQTRTPFFQKITILIVSLSEILNWNILQEKIHLNAQFPYRVIICSLLKLCGQKLQFIGESKQLTDDKWKQVVQLKNNVDLKKMVYQQVLLINQGKLSLAQIRVIQKQFLNDPWISPDILDHELISFYILLMQLYIYQSLKINNLISTSYLKVCVNQINLKRNITINPKSFFIQLDFLEYTYKTLLWNKEEFEISENQPMPTIIQLLDRLVNSSVQKDQPDIQICSGKGKIRMFLDKKTKIDVIQSTFKSLLSKPSKRSDRQEILKMEQRKQSQQKIQKKMNEMETQIIDLQSQSKMQKNIQTQQVMQNERKQQQSLDYIDHPIQKIQ